LALTGIQGIDDGLYHFSIADHALVLLRKGTYSNRLTFFSTGIFFRSAWKYRERAYRYLLLDTGHLLENLILALNAMGFNVTPSYDFDDRGINRFLGLDDAKEVAFAMCTVSGPLPLYEGTMNEISEMPEQIKNASSVAPQETTYPVIQQIHKAGHKTMLPPKSTFNMIDKIGINPKIWTKIDMHSGRSKDINYVQSVLSRRSRRNFLREPLSLDNFSTLLDCLMAGDSYSANNDAGHDLPVCIGLVISGVQDLAPGFYLLDMNEKSLGLAKPGKMMDKVAVIGLNQMWLQNAGLAFLFITNLQELESAWGARGYRYAMITSGRMGERLYLTATGIGVGACGIGAFYDSEASDLLGLNAGSRLLYFVALGKIKKTL
jgi:SagB-type dehydrogenase family enzyme